MIGINSRRIGNILIIDFDGNITILVDENITEIAQGVIQKDCVKIIMNFKKVKYINSSGFKVLIKIIKEVRSRDGRVKIVKISSHLQKIAKMIGLDKISEFWDSEQEALASFEPFLELEVVARLENLSKISDFIDDVSCKFGLDEDKMFDVHIAVGEACENILKHSYPKEKKGLVKIRCELKMDDFVVKIIDQGKPFDFNSVPSPNLDVPLEERAIGGLGIHFMKNLMDEVKYSFDPEKGNELIMKKNR